jgi:hypothetical protein
MRVNKGENERWGELNALFFWFLRGKNYRKRCLSKRNLGESVVITNIKSNYIIPEHGRVRGHVGSQEPRTEVA